MDLTRKELNLMLVIFRLVEFFNKMLCRCIQCLFDQAYRQITNHSTESVNFSKRKKLVFSKKPTYHTQDFTLRSRELGAYCIGALVHWNLVHWNLVEY